MEFLIISGMSGAGKSQAADILEDMGYYCVDNMPLALLPRFAELCLASRGRYDHVALVTDVRERRRAAPGAGRALGHGSGVPDTLHRGRRADHRAPL